MSKYIVGYAVLMNMVSYISMGLDKHKAIKGQWRIPEKRLFLWVMLGGGIGGTIGMYAFRHKTKHWYFKVLFPVITVIEYSGLIYSFIVIG